MIKAPRVDLIVPFDSKCGDGKHEKGWLGSGGTQTESPKRVHNHNRGSEANLNVKQLSKLNALDPLLVPRVGFIQSFEVFQT